MIERKPEFRHGARWANGFRRLLIDRTGVAAVEFALIFPLMITFYFGAMETSHMLTANRRVTSVAYTAADITAQAISVSDADVTDIFSASAAILRPFSTTPLSIRISSVVANSSGVNKVAWSDGYQIAGRAVNSTMTLPAGLTSPGTSVIVAEVTYQYSSPISQTITEDISFTDTAYLKPRRAGQVARTN
jgi:Flp pilus assembly protein TadG